LIRRRYFLIQCGSPEEKEEQKPSGLVSAKRGWRFEVYGI
jgi:hypothetical protein